MNKTRILAAFLAALMLTGTLASCAETAETPVQTEVSTVGGTEAVETETEFTDELPDDLDYNQDEIVILSRYREGWTSGEIAVPELTGEEVNDAVYERNRTVEDRLNVKLISVEEPGDSAYIVVVR